jgi:MFS family permease
VLLAGRALLGAAESFIITGATAWGLSRVGAGNAGKVIAWMGTAMFAGFAAGAPLGTMLYASGARAQARHRATGSRQLRSLSPPRRSSGEPGSSLHRRGFCLPNQTRISSLTSSLITVLLPLRLSRSIAN